MPTVKFEIDPEKEYEYHQLFLDTHGLEQASIFYHSPIGDKTRIVNKIKNFWDEQDKEIISKIEKQWKTIENDYFKQIEEITQVSWSHQAYHAYFLAFSNMIGFSNPFNLDSNEIVLTTGSIINPKFLVGHELFHSHYYRLVDKLGLTKRLNQTIFTEGIASLVIFETGIKNLFSETDASSSINSYSEVQNKWPVLLEHWQQRENLNSFLYKVAQDTRL